MLKKRLPLFLMLCCVSYSYAQDPNKLGLGSSWNKGFVVLNTGERHEGLVRNNDREGIVSIKSETDSTSISVRPSRILSMEYFDSSKGVVRRFISLDSKDIKNEYEGIALYEVVREFSDFAILIYRSPSIVIQSKNDIGGSSNGLPQRNGSTIISQFEIVYFFNQNGESESYLIFENRYIDGLFDYEKSKSRILDSSLPAKYIGEAKWTEVELHMKNKGIKKIKTKEEFLESIELL